MGVVSCGTTMLDQGVFENIGSVSWDTTAKTTGFTAVSGNGYFCNTTSGAFTVTLPVSPSAGDIVGIKDYANTADTNNITIGRNGSNIQGIANDFVINTEGRSVFLVYVDATKGWLVTGAAKNNDLTGPAFVAATGGTISTVGDYKIHTFTGPGTFTVTCAGNPAGSTTVDYLVVAGGAGGGARGGGGGGAGGYRESSGTASGSYTVSPRGSGVSALPVSVTGYPITIGGGGTGGIYNSTAPTNGVNSVFSTITSTGGGGGGHFTPSSVTTQAGQPGGSGGGGNGYGAGVSHPGPSVYWPGGTGNTPPVSPPQGTNGGNGHTPYSVPQINGGGGGGAICAGQPGQSTQPTCVRANGGDGGTSSINGTLTARAGGGGGGGAPTAHNGDGGAGGGGNAGPVATPGTTNTGGGGGGGISGSGSGGNGGSGIIIIRYKFQ
jgi:hypothetical protein